MMNIFYLFLKSEKDEFNINVAGQIIPDVNTSKSKIPIHEFMFTICGTNFIFVASIVTVISAI